MPHTFRRQNNRNVLMNGLHESIFPLHFSADDQGQNEPKTDQDNKARNVYTFFEKLCRTPATVLYC